MNNLILVKIGGGVITDKKVRYGLKGEVLKRIVGEISDGYKKIKRDSDLVIGNGAGSFAHWSANEYKTKDGFSDEKGAIGAGWVRHDAVRLNQIVVEELLRQQIPAFSFSPSSMFQVAGDDLIVAFLGSMKDSLEKGIVPVVYGDPIIDQEKGSTIYSTERVFEILAAELAHKYSKIRVIHISSEEGVYGSDDGGAYPEINIDNWEEIKQDLGGSSGVDVTGGMLHKVEKSLELAKRGVETCIVSGLIPDRVRGSVIGEHVTGTRII